jgi:hypothetical protein
VRAAVLVWTALALSALFGAPAAIAAGAPQLGSAWTASVGTVAASLRAEVNPNGLATTYHFSYLPEAAYQANLGEGRDGFAGALKAPAGADPLIGSGSAAVIVAQPIASLSPDTGYRFRIQANNSAGSEIGPSHLFYTEAFATGSTLLDGRGWELVSPLDKNGGEIQGPGQSFGGGTIQAAGEGSAIAYSSTSSFAGGQGAPPVSQYISRRTGGGWATENVSPAVAAGAYGPEPDGAPFQLFSPSLSRGLLLEGGGGYGSRESAGGAVASFPAEPDLHLAGVVDDVQHLVLSTCVALTGDATEAPLGPGCDPSKPNLYEWSGGAPTLVNLLPAASVGTPGAVLAAQVGAISSDGGRVYWTLGGNLYLREGAVTRQVDEALGGGGTFETASTTGATAFLTKAGHLYRYEAPAGTLTDLTPSGGVQGVLGASADGSRVFYLTTAGLFLRAGAVTTKVADGADASNYPPATGTARVTPDGAYLAFLSNASLTGFDNRDAAGGEPRTEVFLYDALAGSLTCVSCNPQGERPIGSSTIPGATANGKSPTATRAYKPRALSDDGRRLFFDSNDELALADSGKRPDVYEWEAGGTGSCTRAGGCVGLISRGRNSEGGSFLDASASGADVFFLTADSLVGTDTGSADVYDAREGGGFPEPPRPLECAGDACQFLPSEPEDPAPATLTPSVGNGPVRYGKSTATKCKRGFVKRHRHCVRKPRKKHRHGRGAGR